MSRGTLLSGTRLAVLGATVASTMLLVTSAGAGVSPAVRGASLSQQGPDLVWRVQLLRPYSPRALRTVGVCLLVERALNGAVREHVCLAPRGRGRLRLVIARRTVQATVIRTGKERLQASFLPQSIGLHYRRLRWQIESGCSQSSCAQLAPSRPQLLGLHIPRLIGCKARGPLFVLHGPRRGKEIALTFDDGPWYDTPQFLHVLEREHVPATFFEIGEEISQYGQGGSIERRMLRDGDMIGDHTWNHQDVAGAGAFARSEILGAAAAIRRATHGFTPCLFRAPDGAVSPALFSEVRSLGMTTIQWDIDPRDWALPGVGAIESNVLSNATAGGIVEMHDGGGDRSETIDSLPTIIGALRRRGYTFVAVTQLLGYRLIYK